MIKLKNLLTENLTYSQLLKATDDGRKERADNVRTRSMPVSVEDGEEAWNFRYKSNPSVTGELFRGKITFFKEVHQGDKTQDLDCKVDCSCPDYRYRFAYNNAQQNAGDIGNNTLNKCINQKPQPAYDYGIGLCKHLTALSKYLSHQITNTRKSNLFEAMSDVVKQGNFNIEYDE